MSGFLIDTNIISEYNRPAGPNQGVESWLAGVEPDAQYISVLTLAELRKGIELLQPGKRRRELTAWYSHDLEEWFSGRVLPVDRRVAESWATLTSRLLRRGRPLPAIDSLIAATAIAHDLAIVTRNVRDYADSGVETVNPWVS
ncbi:MAG: type II toxin-antitoxin system VapC family toxin [Acidobacteria bacterium]|nr:type II toxin-antitoxin system VapC family toxin [Acidobacteriota bacterium]